MGFGDCGLEKACVFRIGLDLKQQSPPVIGHSREILPFARCGTGSEQGLRVIGVDLQRTGEQLVRLAVKPAAVGLGQRVGVVGEQGGFAIEGGADAGERLGRFGEAPECLVGASEHDPALGIVGIGLEPVDQALQQTVDFLRTHARLRVHRIERLWVAEQGVATGCGERQRNEQGDRRVLCAGTRHGRGGVFQRLDFFQQAALQFASGLFEIALAQRAFVTVALELAQLVAQDVQVGLAAVGGIRRRALAQQRAQQDGQDDQEQRGGAKEKAGGSAHDFGSSEWSN